MESVGDGHEAGVGAESSGGVAWCEIVVALLVGFAFGWLAAGLVQRLHSVFGSVPEYDTLVIAACLWGVGLGVLLPRRLAEGMARFAWPRGRRSEIAAHQSQRDGLLLWVVLASTAMMSGLLVVALPLALHWGESAYSYSREHFLWNASSHAVLVAFIVFGLVVVPTGLIGVVLTCLNQFGVVTSGHREMGASFHWVLLGAVGGSQLVLGGVLRGSAPDLVVILGSVPLFLAAMVSVQQTARSGETEVATSGLTPPDRMSHGYLRLRWLTALATAAVSGSLLVWGQVIGMLGQGSWETWEVHGWLLTAAGCGALLAAQSRSSGEGSGAGPGGAWAMAGLCTIAGGIVVGAIGARVDGVIPGGSLAVAGVCVGVSGAALVLSQQSVMGQSTRRSLTSASLVSECLWIPGVLLFVGVFLDMSRDGGLVALVTLGLVLVGIGASVVLEEPLRSRRWRLARVVAVVSAALGMGAWMPYFTARGQVAEVGAAPAAVVAQDGDPSAVRVRPAAKSGIRFGGGDLSVDPQSTSLGQRN